MIKGDVITKAEGPWLLLDSGHQERILPEGFLTLVLDACRMKSLDDFYNEVSSVLKMPDYFGRNFNALDECLTDLEWLPAEGYLIVIKHAEFLLCNEPLDTLESLLSVFSDTGEEWSTDVAEGNPWDRKALAFHILLEVSENCVANVSKKYMQMKVPFGLLSSG